MRPLVFLLARADFSQSLLRSRRELGGLDDSPSGFQVATSTLIDGYRFWNGTIFDRLETACLDWEVFEGDEFPVTFVLSGMNLYALDGHFTDFEHFRSAIADPDYTPAYAFIEPNYGNILPTTREDFTCGNSQHPLDDVTRGERLIKDVYEFNSQLTALELEHPHSDVRRARRLL